MSRRRFLTLIAVWSLAVALPACADTVTYAVRVNTSSQTGNYGYIDLELNAGTLPSADVMATVTGFSGAALNAADPNNDVIHVSGSLPGPVLFNNQSGNDYFEGLTFGNAMSLLVTLNGAGISNAGSLAGTSGSIFQLSFLDPTMTTPLFTIDPSGTVVELVVDRSGATSAYAQPGANAAVTPEPATLLLTATGIAACLFTLLRTRCIQAARIH